MDLAGFQKKYLRGLAHELKAVVQVGRPGITDEVVQAVSSALEEHELIKVSMRKPQDKKGMAASLASRSEAQLCGLIGHIMILYRPHPDAPTIQLPARTPLESTEETETS
jgi:RNA-binding protein